MNTCTLCGRPARRLHPTLDVLTDDHQLAARDVCDTCRALLLGDPAPHADDDQRRAAAAYTDDHRQARGTHELDTTAPGATRRTPPRPSGLHRVTPP